MKPKILTYKQITTLLGDKNENIIKSAQSNIYFYNLTQKQIEFVKDKTDIDIIDNCIVKKQYIDIKRAGVEDKFGGKIGQYNREKRALLNLQKEYHFPKILFADDHTYTIYMTYCGSQIKRDVDNIPKNWKEQMGDILTTLQKNNIYNNDIHIGNLLINDDTIHLVDFGWATFDNENYPYINITNNEIQEYNKLIELLDMVFAKVIPRRSLIEQSKQEQPKQEQPKQIKRKLFKLRFM